ncbi:MAG: HAMP domain-containing histidine kinase [Sphingomonadales bacterium]|nr:HAMP domain-containing histidine kinase [Sphingomonadales bacterium]
MIALILAVALPLTIDRTIHAIGDDLTRRFLAGVADRVTRGGAGESAARPRSALAVYLFDAAGEHRLAGPPIADIAARPAPAGEADVFAHGPNSDFYERPMGAGRSLVIAEDRRHPGVLIDDITVRFIRRFAFIAPLALLLSTIATLLAMRLALRPVRRAAREADAINLAQPGDVRLDEGALPAEILPLVHAANVLLEQTTAAYRQERVFTATVVHELRTALATISLRAELLPEGEARTALAQAVQRAATVVDQMLELHLHAAEHSTGPGVAIDDAARAIVAEMRGLIERGGRRLVYESMQAAGAAAMVPTALIDVTLRNIIENAHRHSVAGGTIVVACDAAGATVSVSDDGPGINLREGSDGRRIYSRADGVSGGGSGLGLAIVTRSIEAAGGEIAIAPGPQRGTVVTLRYPSLPCT